MSEPKSEYLMSLYSRYKEIHRTTPWLSTCIHLKIVKNTENSMYNKEDVRGEVKK